MSRTYRRKNETWEYYWVLRDWSWNRSITGRKCNKRLTGKKAKKELNKYHSDGAKVLGSAPSWFVRDFCNKPFRAKAKAEVRRMIQKGDYEDYNFNPNKKTAMWLWW